MHRPPSPKAYIQHVPVTAAPVGTTTSSMTGTSAVAYDGHGNTYAPGTTTGTTAVPYDGHGTTLGHDRSTHDSSFSHTTARTGEPVAPILGSTPLPFSTAGTTGTATTVPPSGTAVGPAEPSILGSHEANPSKLSGMSDKVKGSIEKTTGKLVGNAKMQAKGEALQQRGELEMEAARANKNVR